MKKITCLIFLLILGLSFAQKGAADIKTKFTKDVLQQKVQDEEGKEVSLQKIIDQHKGKILVIDFWA